MEKPNLNRGMSVGRMSRAQSARLLQRGTSEKKLRAKSGTDLRGTSFAIDPSYLQGIKDFCQGLLPGLPEHAALKKRAVIFKRGSAIGTGWDIFQVFLSVVACVMYIAESYEASYAAGQVYEMSELIYTQFFTIDFLFNWFIANSTKQHFTSLMSIVDIITIVPVYVTLFVGAKAPNLSLFRFVRILRLIRILRTFRLLGGLSGIKRQLITLTLSLLSLTFVAAGIIQFMENDLNQFGYECQYINANTNYEPSCESDMPTFNSEDCDCAQHNCRAVYARGDVNMEPTGIRCIELPYFDCFYFIVVTMATVGYGDIAPSNVASKIAIILFIITSLILIPMQVNKLSVLLSMHSAFRRSYTPQSHENHVILCGYVNDRSKLERFFKEFFHPDKRYSSAPEFNLVILSPMEPTEDVRSLLVSPLFDIQVTYIIGSALSTDDLKRARADIASAMFFVCNIEVPTNEAYYDDAATVLRTLSVSNFNPELECLVQVLRPEDRDILKDSDVDVILCLDEYKTVVQARNAVCPGLSTFIENIFHSFGQATAMPNTITGQWMTEYLHGCRMEIYYVPLGTLYLEALAYEWNLIVEGIYVEFEVIMIGVCSIPEHAVFFNPGVEELAPFEGDGEAFFKLYNVGILMAPSQSAAELVTHGMNDTLVVDRIMAKMLFAEEDFSVRRLPKIDRSARPSAGGGRHMSVKLSVNTQKTQVTNNFRDLVRHTKMHKRVLKDKVEGGSDSTKSSADTPERRRSITRWHKGFAAAATHVKQQKAIRRVDSTTITDGMEDMKPPAHLGHASQIVTNASHISNHIIVFGCVDNLLLFVKELRRPLGDDNYHPVLIVHETVPPKWDIIAKSFKDVYLLNNVITSSQGFNATNIRDASSVVLLASRDNVTMVEEENLDAEILFTYLKLERYIPRNVFFTVELTHPNNMGVLNSTIMRRKRADVAEAAAVKAQIVNLQQNAMPRSPGQIRGTFSSQRRGSEDKNLTVNRSKSNMMAHNPGRRLSSLELKLKEKNEIIIKENNFWDVYGTHHVLPVFAAGRSFVPSSFDSVLVQSFFGSLTPVLCEQLVCGQGTQAIVQIDMPRPFTGRLFNEIFRAFLSRDVLVVGLYRASTPSLRSVLSYVYTSPMADAVVQQEDKLYVFGRPDVIQLAKDAFCLPLERKANNKIGLGTNPFKNTKLAYNVPITNRHALVIQAAFRGHQARKQMAARRAALKNSVTQVAANKVNKMLRGNRPISRPQKGDLEFDHDRAAKIQAMFRGASTRRKLSQKAVPVITPRIRSSRVSGRSAGITSIPSVDSSNMELQSIAPLNEASDLDSGDESRSNT